MARITDKERLDWLWHKAQKALWPTSTGWMVFNVHDMNRGPKANTPRAAIDAAIKAERKPKEAGR